MTRDRGPQRSPLSPLRSANQGAAAGAVADAVGSSTKDRGWQRRQLGGAAPRPSRLQPRPPQSDTKKSKKVEGTVVAHVPPSAAAPPAAAASRIPSQARRGLAAQEQPAPGSSASRIPRAPAARGGAISPQPDYAAMLATPEAPPQLAELHAEQPWAQQAGHGGEEPMPDGFQAYSNPSFDGADWLRDGPEPRSPASVAGSHSSGGSCGTAARAAGGTPASLASGSRLFINGLAQAGEASDQLTPGLLEAPAVTPNTQRSLEAWLRASPTRQAQPNAEGVPLAHGGAAAPAPSAAGAAAASGRSRGSALPTPEAWQLLHRINQNSPDAAPQGAGMRGIMNAFLRTGPQMLSPEAAGGDMIRAPGAAAVPASGLMNVSGPGGVGVYGMMNALLRTGANLLSPEPGVEAQPPQDAAPQPLLHPYSPASPLAATPAAPRSAAQPSPAGDVAAGASPPSRRPVSPSSVCSNGGLGSSGPAGSISLGGGAPAVASVPRLSLGGLGVPAASEAAEASFGVALARHADSPGSGDLPTARFFGGDSPVAGQEAGGAMGRQQRRPSPITFCLRADSPPEAQQPASAAPTFSFGMGGGPGAPAGAPPAEAEPQAELQAAAAAPAEVPEAAATVPGGAHMRRIESGETVQQPHPFKAMLQHLLHPQYASPARLAAGARPDSPQSPRECTPLHLISMSEGAPASPGAAAATPAPGQGSLTVWMDRRGMRAALSTPARNDLRLLWVAARDIALHQSEAAALRGENAALAEELEAAQGALLQLGAEREAAEVAAAAGAQSAEAELARARDAAGHMMQLADQIQGMFALCESEKEALVGELQAAQQQLAASEAAAAADAGRLEERQAAQLQGQLEEARQAVAAAQQAADAAQKRAGDAAAELGAIRRQLREAQAQLAAARGAPELTPVARLRHRLGGVHDRLAHLHAGQSAGRVPAGSPELDRLLETSRDQLAQAGQLLGGGDASTLRHENEHLHRCLAQARSLLVASSPAGTVAPAAQRGSPLPFALFGLGGGETEAGHSPATTVTLAGSPDVFASPYQTSHTTLTVDYRDLHSSARLADSATSRGSPALSSGAAPPSPATEGSAGLVGGPCPTGAEQGSEAGSVGGTPPSQGCWDLRDGEGREAEYTVVHNGMVITHVPASEVSKVRCMVQYWEAVASGEPLGEEAGSHEEAAAAEAYATAAVAAAEAVLAARLAERAAAAPPAADGSVQPSGREPAGEQEQQRRELEAGQQQPPAGGASQGCPAASPAAAPGTRWPALPDGEAATPGGAPFAAAGDARTPARSTPLRFIAAPPPTPATRAGLDAQQAQQLDVGMAVASVAGGTPPRTPASAPSTGGRPPATPACTPASAAVAAAVTPLALSALRARMGGSGGGVQDAVRSRLARLKADLMAAQAKLATVDQGLAAIAFTPTSSITASGTPGSHAGGPPRRTPPTPLAAAPRHTPAACSGAGSAPAGFALAAGSLAWGASLDGTSRVAAWISGPGFAAAPPQGASPAAVSQERRGAAAGAAAAPPAVSAAVPVAERQASAATVAAAQAAPEGAAAVESTPPPTRRSVRFADSVHGGGCGRAALRLGTPHSGAAAAAAADAADEEAGSEGVPASASPVVASSRRSPLGGAQRRSPLAAHSAAKPAAAAARRFQLQDNDNGSSSIDEDGEQPAFDASRMALGANHAATPSPARGAAGAAAATPHAHPEAARGRAAAAGATPASATSVLSTSSFSPPPPLALLAARPLGRGHRRVGLLRGGAGAGGRQRSEVEDREFRRRAAALNIQISPYFRRPRAGQGAGDAASAE